MVYPGRVVLAGCGVAVNAQAPSGWGYVFGGGGGITNGDTRAIVHIGGGGEGVLAGNFGVGGEVGYLSRTSDFGNGLGIASLNVVAVFNRSADVNPFFDGSRIARLSFRRLFGWKELRRGRADLDQRPHGASF
jgi:hypothetical protein